MHPDGSTKIARKGSYGYLVASYEVWECLYCNIRIYRKTEVARFISNGKVRNMIEHSKDEIIEA